MRRLKRTFLLLGLGLLALNAAGWSAVFLMSSGALNPGPWMERFFRPKAFDAGDVHTKELLSPIYKIDQVYKSMKGPYTTAETQLVASSPPELVWVTGYNAVMVGPDGTTRQSQEFMCHSNLDMDAGKHRELMGWKQVTSNRLFTLSQGQFHIKFPHGFGIPMMSDEALRLTTQVLNVNPTDQVHQVRHKINIQYVRDQDLQGPMTPLLMKAANGMVFLEGEDHGEYNKAPEEGAHGASCLIGTNASTHIYEDKFGRKFSGHWVVPPGRQVNRTPVTEYMNLPYDTRAHYIAVHLHPFAESLELRDVTTGETVFKSGVKAPRGRIGIEYVDYYSSQEGRPFYEDHEYELVSVYNNTSDEDQDSMAVMYIYFADLEFDRSKLQL